MKAEIDLRNSAFGLNWLSEEIPFTFKNVDSAFLNITGQFVIYPNNTLEPTLQIFVDSHLPTAKVDDSVAGAYLMTWMKLTEWDNKAAEPLVLVCRSEIRNEFGGSVSQYPSTSTLATETTLKNTAEKASTETEFRASPDPYMYATRPDTWDEEITIVGCVIELTLNERGSKYVEGLFDKIFDVEIGTKFFADAEATPTDLYVQEENAVIMIPKPFYTEEFSVKEEESLSK